MNRHDGDKMGMVHSAWKLGLDGINYKDVWYDKADTGTCCHEMVRYHLAEFDIEQIEWPYEPEIVSGAENGFIGFLEWKDELKSFEPILVEKSFVSEKYKLGFTLDLLARVGRYIDLYDIKTGKAIYGSDIVQVSGQKKILEDEFDYKIDRAFILHLRADSKLMNPEFHAVRIYDSKIEPAQHWFHHIAQANPYYKKVFGRK